MCQWRQSAASRVELAAASKPRAFPLDGSVTAVIAPPLVVTVMRKVESDIGIVPGNRGGAIDKIVGARHAGVAALVTDMCLCAR